MSIKPEIANGVAPIWVSVTDGAGWTISDGQNTTGFFVGGTGDVAFKSDVTGSFIVRSLPDFYQLPCRVRQIGTTAEGTTATGIMVATTG
mgnify:CR=1 FL=1|tara:strand:+ start:94 stop:363 length:270 start_codon:yes stop_codon:yes gene_type:complete